MAQKAFKREPKGDDPILAICYDFDKTLAPKNMQEQGFIQAVGYDVDAFWKKSNGLAEQNDMDQNLAYMYMMKQKSAGKVLFTKKELKEYGSKIKLFNGVEKWFERICAYGEKRHVEVEHYIISSGLKEMIEGTPVARYFKAIYASSFYYNERGVAVWPTQVVNYTNKTQYLFRIEKGVLDVNDQAVNDFFPPDELRIPFRNIIYIGDSDTDIPCMSLVNKRGGHAIGVYADDKDTVFKMMRDGRIKYFVKADYTEGFELDTLVKNIIDRTFANEILERKYYSCLEECSAATKEKTEEKKQREELIMALENSNSFKRTHSVIAGLRQCKNWTRAEKERLAKICVTNSQVWSISDDPDIAYFYRGLLEGEPNPTDEMRQILKDIEPQEGFDDPPF